jgi:peptide/nickel transport system permease protein
LTLGIRPLAVVIQLTRNSAVDVLGTSYVRTARSKGISSFRLLTHHVVRNALNPVLTAASGWFASMLAGAVFVEYVFGWRGMGLLMFRALEQSDLPVVLGCVSVVAVTFVAINMLVDLAYGWLDPRVKLSSAN